MYSIGGINALEIAEEFSTPTFVYDLDKIKAQFSNLDDSISYPNSKLHYAVKANLNPEILKLLLDLGCNVECVSPGAVKVCLDVGFKPEQVIVTCNGMSEDEMQFYISNNIQLNLDSLNQLELFGKLNPGGKTSLRINKGIGAGHHEHVVTGGPRSKFGIGPEDLKKAVDIAKKHEITINGMHQHIGSNIFDNDLFAEAVQLLMNSAKKFPDLEFLDVGGGFGIPYESNDESFNTEEFGKLISSLMEKFNEQYGKELRLVLEPGRFLVGEAGVLLAEVTDVKKAPHRVFVALNTGMHHLVRPAMYQAHHNLVNVSNDEKKEKCTVVGNVCETADTFAWDFLMSPCRVGDIIAIENAGAYGFVMSSYYNTRGLPSEVVIKDGKPFLTTKREKLW